MIAADPTTRRPALDLAGRSFIEVQFPVAKLSKESYKERKAKDNQTLPGLGKWWGRKPLVLVRAIILGFLLPATDDPDADRDVFLALMTMDDEGLLRRWRKSIPARVVWKYCSPRDRELLFQSTNGRTAWKTGVSYEDRNRAQKRAFLAMSYDDKLDYCLRPEEIDGPGPQAWRKTNAHLSIDVQSLPELVSILGMRRWGHAPCVGDAFCGGGSIPFEAARMGCTAIASDLNPVAGLLTWGAFNIVGGGEHALDRLRAAEERVFAAVRDEIDEWGIERSQEGWIADTFLYCNEVRDPNTGWIVPLAPSWVIAEQSSSVVGRLVPETEGQSFRIEVVTGVTASELEHARREGTAQGGLRSPISFDGTWLPIEKRQTISMEQVRGPGRLRPWERTDLVPRTEDVFQERLYCIRWTDPSTGRWVYSEVKPDDLRREQLVLELLTERFAAWQSQGFLPSRRIEPGQKTDEPIRTRGWTHWHHLFNPRQLLLIGLVNKKAQELGLTEFELAGVLLGVGRLADMNSRLCRWNSSRDQTSQTFYNQALNTLSNYGCRSAQKNLSVFLESQKASQLMASATIELADARTVSKFADVWITDPGYGDIILYDELSEFFLAWIEKPLLDLFPHWYADSRRALTVKGEGDTFRSSMAECYANLARHMPDDGMQVVMFVHQDPEVWADVGLTLWAAGLHVQSARTVVTETPTAGIRGGGNYVQGTVNLVLRKRVGGKHGDLADLFPEIQDEVRRQIEEMQNLDDLTDPNFGDADLQLAAYAAALRVLTGYAEIDEIDVERELRRTRARGEESPLAKLIRQAVRIASDYLVPKGLAPATWRALSPEERLYLKGIETEATGEAREGVYQELARGYGAGPHRELYASRAANRVRFKTPTEFGSRDLRRVGEEGFAGSTLRQLLLAIAGVAAHAERDPRPARVSLRAALPNYWTERERLADLLVWLSDRASTLAHWGGDAEAARLLATSLRNDNV